MQRPNRTDPGQGKFEKEPDRGPGQRRQDRLQRRRPEEAPALPPQLGDIQLDADFEE